MIGPEPKPCCVCKVNGMPGQDVMPYLSSGKSHHWAHPACAQAAHRSKYGPPETDLAACGGVEGEG